MAKTPERAMELMEAVWTPAVARVREEVADMQAIADTEGPRIKIEPWDYRYYAEKVRKAKYDLDENEVKPYLQLEKLREGMFWVAGELFGFAFTPVTGVPVYHPDVRVWEVKDRAGQARRPLVLRPLRARRQALGRLDERLPQPGALRRRGHHHRLEQLQLREGQARRAGADQLGRRETLFHEFGHALHGLSSNVTYPSLSGTAVARDYVEFPSQLLEHWLSTPEVLNRFALHYQTGKPIPKELVEQDREGGDLQPGLRHRRVPGQRARRHEAAPGRRRDHRPRRVRAARRSPRSACRARS